jgi:hypothetical protein
VANRALVSVYGGGGCNPLSINYWDDPPSMRVMLTYMLMDSSGNILDGVAPNTPETIYVTIGYADIPDISVPVIAAIRDREGDPTLEVVLI